MRSALRGSGCWLLCLLVPWVFPTVDGIAADWLPRCTADESSGRQPMLLAQAGTGGSGSPASGSSLKSPVTPEAPADGSAPPTPTPPTTPPTANSVGQVILLIGAGGTNEFARTFEDWSDLWIRGAALGGPEVAIIRSGSPTQKDDLQRLLASHVGRSELPLWLVLIGHGTYDGRDARFNLDGPDVSAKELAGWLQPIERPLAVIHCAAASGAFLEHLSAPGRIVVTSTQAGGEINFSRFGGFFAEAISSPPSRAAAAATAASTEPAATAIEPQTPADRAEAPTSPAPDETPPRDGPDVAAGPVSADLDKDGQVSVLEAFLTASRRTHAYYEERRQLPTEHALLDDNGDGLGVPVDFFEGSRPVKRAEGGQTIDGHRARQWALIPSPEERQFPDELRPRRNELELQIAALRDRRSEFEDDEYYSALEPLLIELAELYEQADRRREDPSAVAP